MRLLLLPTSRLWRDLLFPYLAPSLALITFAVGVDNSYSANLLITGAFSATPDSDISSLQGSFQLSFDDSIVTGTSADEEFQLVPLTSISLNPNPFGTTIFDTTNTKANLTFYYGQLITVFVGGTVAPSEFPNTIPSSFDDFWVWYVGTGSSFGSPIDVSASVASQSQTIGRDQSPTGSLLITPEPSRAALLLLALVILLCKQRR